MKLPRFQFGLRTLLIAVTVAALPLGWLSYRLRQAERQRDAVAKLRAMNSGQEHEITYDWEMPPDGSPPQEPQPTWLRKVLGNDFFDRAVAVRGAINPEHLERFADPQGPRLIAELPELRSLALFGHLEIDDRSVLPLAGLGRLRGLTLACTNVGSDGPACLSQMADLEILHLENTQVTDEGLVHLAPLARLKSLYLDGTKISGKQLARLNALINLENLGLSDTSVRPDDLAVLQLPKLQSLSIGAGRANLEPAPPALSPHVFDGLPNLQILELGPAAAQLGLMEAILRLPNLTGLDLQGTHIADVDLERIGRLSHLHTLSLQETRVSDAGLRSLARLPELAELMLGAPQQNGPLTMQGFKTLQRALPELQIRYDTGEGFQQFRLSDAASPWP